MTRHEPKLNLNCTNSEWKAWQFSLRLLFAATFVIAVLLATRLFWGSFAVLVVGIPAALFGFEFIRRGKISRIRTTGETFQQTVAGWLPLGICLILGAGTVFSRGYPSNTLAWFGLIGPMLWAVWLLLKLRRKWQLALSAFPMFTALTICIPPTMVIVPAHVDIPYKIIDDAGGRSGWRMPPGLIFSRPGSNTKSIESYIGYVEPHWIGLGRGPDLRRSYLIHDREFKRVLGILPHEDARAQLIACLIDPQNHLRYYQAALVVAAYTYGFPQGLTATKWWEFHEPLFQPQHDADRAVCIVAGWLNRFEHLVLSHHPHMNPTDLLIVHWQLARSQAEPGSRDLAFRKSLLQNPNSQDGDPSEPLNVIWWNTDQLGK